MASETWRQACPFPADPWNTAVTVGQHEAQFTCESCASTENLQPATLPTPCIKNYHLDSQEQLRDVTCLWLLSLSSHFPALADQTCLGGLSKVVTHRQGRAGGGNGRALSALRTGCGPSLPASLPCLRSTAGPALPSRALPASLHPSGPPRAMNQPSGFPRPQHHGRRSRRKRGWSSDAG